MSAEVVPGAGSMPRRARHLIPTGLPRRGEVMAGCAVLIIALHLMLAPVTLVLTGVFAVLTRVSRWRLWWLCGPAAAGLAWVLLTGPGGAVTGFAAGPSRVLSYLGGGHLLASLSHPSGAFAGAAGWLPRQFPLALIAAAAEAAIVGWLAWLGTDEWAVPPPRPGVVAVLRGALATRLIRAGAVLTRDGCALGISRATGATVTLSWAEVAGGVLVTGVSEQAVTVASLQLAHAALRRRRPLIVLDLTGDASLASAVAAACAATGVPLHVPAAAAEVPEMSGASGLWGRGGPAGPREAGTVSAAVRSVAPDGAGAKTAGLGRVIMERSATLLWPCSADDARQACSDIAALGADLRRIGVDGDGLVWVRGADRLPVEALASLLPGGLAAGLPALLSTSSPAAAAELSGLVGAVLTLRLAAPDCAAALAAVTGTRLRPSALAEPRSPAQEIPRGPLVAGSPAASPVPAFAGMPADAAASAELVPCPVVSARTLLALDADEFVLAVSVPRYRLVERGRLVAARLPPAATAPARGAGLELVQHAAARSATARPTGAEAGWRGSVP